MMNLSSRAEWRWLSDLIADVQAAAPEARILLVGAMARNILLDGIPGVNNTRASVDVDLACAAEDWDHAGRIRELLISSGAFTGRKGVFHQLQHSSGTPLDLIPFGAIEDARGNIIFPPDEGKMNVLGYQEAWRSAVQVTLPKGRILSVVSWPALTVLKILAWNDRKDRRPGTDAYDLRLLMRHYADAENQERVIGMAEAKSAEGDFDYVQAGAELLGRDVTVLLAGQGPDPRGVLDHIAGIVSPETDPDGKLLMASQMDRRNPEEARLMVVAFSRGMRANRAA